MRYKRVLLKLSGQAVSGNQEVGFDPDALEHIADQVLGLRTQGVEISIVIGGGNIFRGTLSAQWGIERAEADNIGMMGTVLNSLMLRGVLSSKGNGDVEVRVMTAIPINTIAEPFIRLRAIHHLEKGYIVIFAGGTGNPYFTTDTAASLRAMEIGADVIFKATKVDGIYSSDPRTDKSAVKYDELTYIDVLKKGLKVMDSTSVSLCMDNKLPMVIFNVNQRYSIKRVLLGEKLGTTVGA